MLGSLDVNELEARSGYLVSRPEELPAFSLREPVSLLRDRGPESSVPIPAGTRMVPLGYALQMEATELGQAFIALWKPLDRGRLHWLGYMSLADLKVSVPLFTPFSKNLHMLPSPQTEGSSGDSCF